MRIILLILAGIASVIGIIMTILPFGNIAILPGVFVIIVAAAAYFLSKKQQKPHKMALLFVAIGLFTITGSGSKALWVKDEVAVDKDFEQKEEQSKEEAIKELKEIESELEELEEIEIEE